MGLPRQGLYNLQQHTLSQQHTKLLEDTACRSMVDSSTALQAWSQLKDVERTVLMLKSGAIFCRACRTTFSGSGTQKYVWNIRQHLASKTHETKAKTFGKSGNIMTLFKSGQKRSASEMMAEDKNE